MSEKQQLSALQRPEILKNLAVNTYDLLIVGGGITGAGIALDAAARGMKVALIERNDFASGTSSRSTKLIHGGLRYLKQFEFGLVRETGSERAIIYQNAPHVVKSEKMLLPIIKGGSLGKTLTSVGLLTYDFLAGVDREERRKMLGKAKTKKQEPLLRDDILLGGGLYQEYRTDDARLVIEVMKTAREFGADIVNYVQANDFIYQDGSAVGVKAEDTINGGQLEIKAKKIVNAAGPWVDELRKADDSLKGKRLHLTKGVHLVVPYEKFPLKQSAYFDMEDGRMIFAIPRDKITYIGTTDTDYKGNISEPTTTKADVDYLLKGVKRMFPSIDLKPEDISSSWAGLRPLIHEDGKSPSELSRKDEIFISPSGVVSIAGGKLTGFRKMAERTVNLVARQLLDETGEKYGHCRTDKILLSGGDFDSEREIQQYKDTLFGEAKQVEVSFDTIDYLVSRYGSNAGEVIEIAYNIAREITDPEERILIAELQYCMQQEMVLKPADFFIRRTGRLYFRRETINGFIDKVAGHLAKAYDWTDDQTVEFTKAFEEEYKEVITFK